MTIKQYVIEILCVPMTRVGYKFIVEGIELALDTHEYKVYPKLSEIHQVSAGYLERAMRMAKNLSLNYMPKDIRNKIFGLECPATIEYIARATEYYRENYADKEEG